MVQPGNLPTALKAEARLTAGAALFAYLGIV